MKYIIVGFFVEYDAEKFPGGGQVSLTSTDSVGGLY